MMSLTEMAGSEESLALFGCTTELDMAPSTKRTAAVLSNLREIARAKHILGATLLQDRKLDHSFARLFANFTRCAIQD
jgi:hypothetical protein